eukprot:366007-Chlamydomonas_euryale.AAC.2
MHARTYAHFTHKDGRNERDSTVQRVCDTPLRVPRPLPPPFPELESLALMKDALRGRAER